MNFTYRLHFCSTCTEIARHCPDPPSSQCRPGQTASCWPSAVGAASNWPPRPTCPWSCHRHRCRAACKCREYTRLLFNRQAYRHLGIYQAYLSIYIWFFAFHSHLHAGQPGASNCCQHSPSPSVMRHCLWHPQPRQLHWLHDHRRDTNHTTPASISGVSNGLIVVITCQMQQ